MIDFIESTQTIDHPLEEVFDIEKNSTEIAVSAPIIPPIVTTEHYDNKDEEIEEQLQEVYVAAMAQYEDQSETAKTVEGKYRARNGEVAMQALKVALDAVEAKSGIKKSKDKIEASQNQGPTTQNNNLIITDRNDLLKLLDGKE